MVSPAPTPRCFTRKRTVTSMSCPMTLLRTCSSAMPANAPIMESACPNMCVPICSEKPRLSTCIRKGCRCPTSRNSSGMSTFQQLRVSTHSQRFQRWLPRLIKRMVAMMGKTGLQARILRKTEKLLRLRKLSRCYFRLRAVYRVFRRSSG